MSSEEEITRLTSEPRFLLQASRDTTNSFVGHANNIAAVEALFDYYRQLPGQPDVWHGRALFDNPEDFYSRPVFIDSQRTQWWPNSFDILDPLESSHRSSCRFSGSWSDPSSRYGVNEDFHIEMTARWGQSEWGCTDICRDVLSMSFQPGSYAVDQDTFIDVLCHVELLWRADVVGFIDLNALPLSPRITNDAEWVEHMVAGIVDGEYFMRQELEDYFSTC